MHIHKNIIFSLLVILLSACNNAVQSPYPNLTLTELSPMSPAGRASATGFSVDGKGYVTFGRIGKWYVNRTALKDLWQFDPATQQWTRKSDFPGTARVKAIAVTLDTVVYVGLGFDTRYDFYTSSPGHLRDFWCYHPSTDTWVQKDSFPSHFTDGCIGFAYKGNIYAGFGFNGAHFSKEMWKYSPSDDSWTRLNDFPAASRVEAVACVDSDKVFFGTGYNTSNMDDWWEYFPDNDTWKQMKSMPDNGRENAVSFNLDGHVIVATGRHFAGNLTGGSLKNDFMEYDPIRNVWYKRGVIPEGNRENAISFTINGIGYIGFGENDSTVLNDFWQVNE